MSILLKKDISNFSQLSFFLFDNIKYLLDRGLKVNKENNIYLYNNSFLILLKKDKTRENISSLMSIKSITSMMSLNHVSIITELESLDFNRLFIHLSSIFSESKTIFEVISSNEITDLTKSITKNLSEFKRIYSACGSSMSPVSLTKEVINFQNHQNININILSNDDLKEKGMNCIVAVGKGATEKSRVVNIDLNMEVDNDAEIVLIGKGITFDSGGLSLKPSRYMVNMNRDMMGAALIYSIMSILSEINSKLKVSALIGIAENAIGPESYKVSDVIQSYSGKKVEVLNTDAEGRLVLADLITYAEEKYTSAKLFIDIATLTGSIVQALGPSMPGFFCKNDDLADKLLSSSKITSEPLWRMPLRDEISDALLIKNSNMDGGNLSNVIPDRLGAGAIEAAEFLKHFFSKKESIDKWMHFDIAGYVDSERGFYNHTYLIETLLNFFNNI